MVKVRDITRIKPYPYSIKRGMGRADHRPVVGLDTETDEGRVTLIADHLGYYKVIHNLDELLDYIFRGPLSKTLNFFYNLDYDASAILKHLPYKNLDDLTDDTQTVYRGWRGHKLTVDYIPRKRLKLTVPKEVKKIKQDGVTKFKVLNHNVCFYDISQFYGDNHEDGSGGGRKLTQTYERIFKTPYTKRLDASKQFPVDEIDREAVQYCIEDARACHRLSQHFVKLTRSIVNLRSYFSGASLGKALLRKHLWSERYKFNNTKSNPHYSLHKNALLTYGGGRIETFKRGRVGACNMADINSAYPWAMTQLWDMQGSVTHTTEYLPDCKHGFYRISADIPEYWSYGPLRYEIKNMLFYPVGYLPEVWVTKTELELLRDHAVPVEILEATQLINDDRCHPFQWVNDIYGERCRLKDAGDPRELVYKTALNAGYGSLIQTIKKKVGSEDGVPNPYDRQEDWVKNKRGHYTKTSYEYRAGAYFQPVYAAEITALTRVKLFKDTFKRMKDVIMYATDSITTQKPLKLDYTPNKLGAYSQKTMQDGYVLGSGVYTLIDDTGRPHLGSRGFGKRWNVLQVAQEHPNETEAVFPRTGPYKFKESQRDWSKLNIFRPPGETRTLNPGFDYKRVWNNPGVPTFGQLLETLEDSTAYTPALLDEEYRRRINPTSILKDVEYDTFDYLSHQDASLSVNENRENLEVLLRSYRRL